MTPISPPTSKIWWRASLAVFNGMNDLNLGLISAGVAFYAMLAIFPAIAAIIALWGVIADPVIVDAQVQLFRGLVPPEAFAILDTQVSQLVRANNSALGWATAISTGAALWSSRAGVAALIRGLNAIYHVSNRNSFRQVFVALALTFALIGMVLVALASVVIVPIVLAFLPLGPLMQLALSSVRWIVAGAVVMFGLGVIYRYGPNRRRSRPAWFTSGAVVAVVIWGLASYGFSLYLANFGKYNEIYGALGAVIALLMWFYISAYVVLLGASLNAELDRARLRMTSSGSEPAEARAPLPDPPAADELI